MKKRWKVALGFGCQSFSLKDVRAVSREDAKARVRVLLRRMGWPTSLFEIVVSRRVEDQ